MNITISSVTGNETRDFEIAEWTSVDEEHWGGEIDWDVEDFYFKAWGDDNNILGTIKGKFEAGVVFVDQLVVGEKSRGLGIGTKLMKYIEEWGKKKGAHKIFLFTQEKWKASDFYKKLGYKNTGVLENHYLHGDFIIYSKFVTL